jgi:alkanesulfonate monooxygenase
MTVELIGMIDVHREQGSSGASVHVIGGGVDPAYLRDFTRVHEDAGFDTILVGYTSTSAVGRELMPLVRAEVARRHTAVASKETL